MIQDVLFGLNVFNVKSQERSRILVQTTIFTAIACPVTHQSLGGRIHGLSMAG
jgi:hypothetical protein